MLLDTLLEFLAKKLLENNERGSLGYFKGHDPENYDWEFMSMNSNVKKRLLTRIYK